MNLGLYAHLARRWLLLAVIPALAVGAGVYFYTNHQTPMYQTTETLYIQQPGDVGSGLAASTDIYSSEALIPTYTQMLGSPVISAAVDAQMGALYPGYRLANHSLSISGGASATNANVLTQLMEVTVTDSNPKRAAAAAQTVSNVFIKQVTNLQRTRFSGNERILQTQINQAQSNIQYVSQQLANGGGSGSNQANLRASLTAYQSIYQSLIGSVQDFQIAKATALHAVTVFSPAGVPSSPVPTNALRTGLLLAFVTLLLCGGAIILYDYVDDTPRTPEEIEEVVGAPILGTVPRFSTRRLGTQLASAAGARSPLAEAYRVIRTNLQYINIDNPPRSIVITSPSPSEGKSTTASNLANVFAEAGKKVTLVDADLRRPSLHRIFNLSRQDGLTNALVGNQSLNGQWSQTTSQPNLTLIACGAIPPRPADLLGSERMKSVVHHLRDTSDMVFLDSPPVMAVTDAAILSTVADGVVLVVDPAKSKRRDLRRSRESIEAVGGTVLGAIINRLERHGAGYYYYYYRHNYGYSDSYVYMPPRDEETPKSAKTRKWRRSSSSKA